MPYIRPDGFAGGLMAAEGFSDCRTILHGPGGCRYRYMRLSRELYPRNDGPDLLEKDFFYGNPRIPCTFLDEKDYVYGGYRKLEEALRVVAGTGCPLIVIVNSPATALIGDNTEEAIVRTGLEGRAMTLDFNPVSESASEGADRVSTEIVRFIVPKRRTPSKGRVNILGVPLFCRDWTGTVSEVRRLLSMMGLDARVAIGAGSSVEDVRGSGDADLNVSVFPEYSGRLSRYYNDELGIGCVRTADAPIGFEGTRRWLEAVADAVSCDPSKAIAAVDDAEFMAKKVLRSDGRRASRLTGSHFTAMGEGSLVRPLESWLREFLSMIPEPASEDLPDHIDYLLGPGDFTGVAELSGRCDASVDIGFPPRRRFSFRNDTVVGVQGAMNLLDEICNRLRGD